MFTLHNGDCLTVLPSIPSGSIDAIITDLPYGTTACKWDTVIPFEPMWKEVKRVLKPNGVFVTTSSQPFSSALIMSNPKYFKYEWIWNKQQSGNFQLAKYQPLKTHENILVFGGSSYNPIMQEADLTKNRPNKENLGKTSGLKHLSSGEYKYSKTRNENIRYPVTVINGIHSRSAECNSLNRIHPTQKPVALYEYLIKTYTNEGETVLDIAMGSGTTIEAAERTGRNSIGIEKDEGIFQSAVLRLKPFTPSNTASSGRVDSSRSPELFPAEVESPAKVTRQSARR